MRGARGVPIALRLCEVVSGIGEGGRLTKTFEAGQRVRLPGEAVPRTTDMAAETAHGWQLFVDDGAGVYRRVCCPTGAGAL